MGQIELFVIKLMITIKCIILFLIMVLLTMEFQGVLELMPQIYVNISSNISYSKSNKWALGILAEPILQI